MALQGAAYYLGMLAYYWVLVTPSVGFLFGCYLYMSVNWFHVHYDEAFSSLQIPHHKGFSRIHVTPEGDLHIYGLAIDKVGIHQLCEDMCCSQTECIVNAGPFPGTEGCHRHRAGRMCAVSLLSGYGNCTCRRHAHGALGPVQDRHVQLNGSPGT